MCIRDRIDGVERADHRVTRDRATQPIANRDGRELLPREDPCLLYTSDAADERSSVDLGGRRIIKKKKKVETDTNARTTTNVDT